MHMLTVFALTLLVGFVCTYPSITDDINKVTVTKDILSESLIVYEGEHEIVNIFVPLNTLNYGSSAENLNYLYFFVEADDNEYGERTYKGLYVVKDGIPKKLLDNGRDATAGNEYSEDVFLAGEDGIYRYNDVEESAEKYGSVKESIIGIEKATGKDLIYILTENGEVYQVTGQGNKKNLIKEIVGAKQILLDYENNLYYVDYNNLRA